MSEEQTARNSYGVSRRLYRLNARMGFALVAIVALSAFIIHIKAAQVTNRRDAESTQAAGANAVHHITFNLSATNTFAAGEQIELEFPSGFTPNGSWAAGDFSFSDGVARVIAGINAGPGISTVVCPDAPNNVGIAFDTTGLLFRVIPCGASFSSSIAGAFISFDVDGTAPDGLLANPLANGSYSIQFVDGAGDCQSVGDGCTLAVAIISQDAISVSAWVASQGTGGGGGGGNLTPPVISNIHTANGTTNSIDVCWDTNKSANSTVNYGATNTYGSQQTLAGLVTTRCVSLSSLTEGATYHYQVCSTDGSNNQTCSGDLTFTILDLTPPVISALQITNVTCTSVTVAWSTNELATSFVDYSVFTGPPYPTTVGSATPLGTSHAVTVGGLAHSQVYHYRARSADTQDNESFTGDATFVAASSCTADVTPPVISNVTSTNITDTTAHICWDTDELADSTLNYGQTTAYGATLTDTTMTVLAHCFDVTGLTPGTTYHYQISSKDPSNNLAISADFNFLTMGVAPIVNCTVDCTKARIEPYIINPDGTERKAGSMYVHVTQIDATHTRYNFEDKGATFDWNDVVVDVSRGDCSQLTFTAQPSTAAWDHVVRGEIYYNNILQKDILVWASTKNASNSPVVINESQDQSVCSGAPPIISNVTATNIAIDAARITWSTDVSADSRVDYGVTDSYGHNVSDALTSVTHQQQLTGLIPNTLYHYRVRSTEANDKTAISIDRTFTTLPDNTPPANVTNLTATPGNARVTLAWTNPTDVDFSGVVVRRSTTGFPASETDGTSVYRGTGTTIDDLGVTNGIFYHYAVFAFDAVLNYSSGAIASATPVGPPDTTPPGDVIGFTAVPGDASVQLSWTNPSDLDYQGVRIVRKLGSFPTSRTDGTLVYDGNGSSQLDTGLTNGTAYYYAAYAYDAIPNYAAGVTVSATPNAPPDTTPPGPVMHLTASPGDAAIQLSWTNPTDPDWAGTRVMRTTGGNPTGPADGTLVFDSASDSHLDSGLSNGTTYYYGAYAYDKNHNIAQGVFVSATPLGTLPPPGAICTDSDGGHDYATVGTVTVNGVAVGTDTCRNADTLIENYCEGNVARTENHDCGNGYQCNAGRCKPKPPVQNGETCGNGTCGGNENTTNCPQDCPATPSNPPVPVPVPTVSAGEALSVDDLRFYTTSSRIQLRATAAGDLHFYRDAAFTVMIPDPSIRKPIKNSYLNFNNAAYLMRQTASYEATVKTPNQGGSAPLDVIVNYQDGTTDAVHVNVVLENRGFIYDDTAGSPALSGTRVTLYVDNGGGNFGIWDGTGNGQVNPQVTGADGTYAFIVDAGTYKLVAEKVGYGSFTTSAFPNSTENIINKSIGLIKLPPPLKLTNPQSVIDNTNYAAKVIVRATKDALSNPDVQAQAKNIAAPAATIATVANVAAIGVATATAIPYLLYLWSLFAHPFMLIARRRRKQWGVVYDSLTKRPIDLTILRLTDAKTGRIVRSAVTDKEGRYFFIVQKGTYRMTVVKAGYVFPTTFLKNEKEDANYIDLYHGEEIDVMRETTITANVPLDAVNAEKTPRRILLEGIARRFQKSLGIFAILAMIVATIITPTILIGSLLAANVVLYFVFRRLSVTKKPKNWGIVYDDKSLRPLENVVARIFDTRFNKLLETQVTDIRGRYAFLVGNSTYYVTFEKPGYQKQQRGPVVLTDEKKPGMKVVAEDIALPRGTGGAVAKPGASTPTAPGAGPQGHRAIGTDAAEVPFAPSTPLGTGPLRSLPLATKEPSAASESQVQPAEPVITTMPPKPVIAPNSTLWEAKMLARLRPKPAGAASGSHVQPAGAAAAASVSREPPSKPASADLPQGAVGSSISSSADMAGTKPLPDNIEDLLNPHLERQLLQDAEHAHPPVVPTVPEGHRATG